MHFIHFCLEQTLIIFIMNYWIIQNTYRHEYLIKDSQDTIRTILRGRGITSSKSKPKKRKKESYSPKQHYYINQKYLTLYNQKTIKMISKYWNTKLEQKFGHSLHPKGAPWIQQAEMELKKRGMIKNLFRSLLSLLWWVVAFSFSILIIITIVLLLWQSSFFFMDYSDSNENNDHIDGDKKLQKKQL